MPTYNFEDKDGNVTTLKMSMSEREDYLKEHPELRQVHYSGLPIGYTLHRQKPDQGFRDILRESKRHNRGSTLDIP